MKEGKLFRVFLVANLLTFVLIPLILYMVYQVRSIVSPVLFALLAAYLLYPAVEYPSRLGVPRIVSTLVIVFVMIGSIVLVTFSLIPAVQQQVNFLFVPVSIEHDGNPEKMKPGQENALDRPPGPNQAQDWSNDSLLELKLALSPSQPEMLEADGATLTIPQDPEGLEEQTKTRLVQLVDNFLKKLTERGLLPNIGAVDVFRRIAEVIADQSVRMLRNITGLALQGGRFVMIFLFVLVFALLDGQKIQRSLVALIPNDFFESSLFILYKTQRILGDYLRGLFVENLILGILAFVLMLPIVILKDFSIGLASLIALLIALTNVIRIIGPYIGGVIGVVIAAAVTPDMSIMLGIVIVVIIVQLLDNVLILPMVMRDQVNIHPVVCLLGVLMGGLLAGVLGMILAIPVIGGIKVVFRVLSVEMKRFVEPGDDHGDYTAEEV